MSRPEARSPDRVVLSSSATWYLKFVAWWLLPVGVAIWVLLVGAPKTAILRLLLPVLTAVITVVSWRTGSRLLRVTATATGLEISNYRVTIAVPYMAIERVDYPRTGWPAEIWLKEPTKLGLTLRFMPGPLVATLDDPPAVLLLRERVERERAAVC